jgi:hypothetical protein
MSFYSNIEEVLKQYGDMGLEHLMFYAGIELELYRQLKSDVYSRVHGKNSGGGVEKVKDFSGILVGDDFFQSSDSFSGNFVNGYLYITKEEEILIGDIIAIKSTDLKSRRYKIDKEEQIGFTIEIFRKYKIINLGE